MRTDNVTGNVYSTMDYTKFKKLDGNRDVTKSRVDKILMSIQKNGYICNPIIVNEKFEVIDGQARIEAFQKAGVPLEYIVRKGLSIKDCIALNVYQTKWTIMDYVCSYSNMGNISYSYLKKLCEMFPEMNIPIIVSAIFGRGAGNASSNNYIMQGKVVCDADQYQRAQDTLMWLRGLMPYIPKEKGAVTLIQRALIFAYNQPDIDIEKLTDRVRRYAASELVKPYLTVEGAMNALNAVYNYKNSKGERYYFDKAYDEAIREKLSISQKQSRKKKKQ